MAICDSDIDIHLLVLLSKIITGYNDKLHPIELSGERVDLCLNPFYLSQTCRVDPVWPHSMRS